MPQQTAGSPLTPRKNTMSIKPYHLLATLTLPVELSRKPMLIPYGRDEQERQNDARLMAKHIITHGWSRIQTESFVSGWNRAIAATVFGENSKVQMDSSQLPYMAHPFEPDAFAEAGERSANLVARAKFFDVIATRKVVCELHLSDGDILQVERGPLGAQKQAWLKNDSQFEGDAHTVFARFVLTERTKLIETADITGDYWRYLEQSNLDGFAFDNFIIEGKIAYALMISAPYSAKVHPSELQDKLTEAHVSITSPRAHRAMDKFKSGFTLDSCVSEAAEHEAKARSEWVDTALDPWCARHGITREQGLSIALNDGPFNPVTHKDDLPTMKDLLAWSGQQNDFTTYLMQKDNGIDDPTNIAPKGDTQ